MSKTIPVMPTYDELATALAEAKSAFSPAQVHGLFCGYISATTGRLSHDWENIIFGTRKKNQSCRELLMQLYENSYHQMVEFSFEFTLLLPDDDVDINIRTEALGLWCQGFLSALEQSNIPTQNREDSEVTDALNDLIEIAQVNFGDLTGDEEDETAYFELVEYVRLAALMIFQEFSPMNSQDASDEDSSLH